MECILKGDPDPANDPVIIINGSGDTTIFSVITERYGHRERIPQHNGGITGG